MASLYCDYTNGDDANAGTALLPKKTLQATVNIAIGGDTIFIANTSAQVLTAAITWNTGYVVTSNRRLKIQSWDNGGAITIQRPDESTSRVGAVIDGDNIAIDPFAGAGTKPYSFIVQNIRFQNMTTHAYRSITTNEIVTGCEMNGSSVGNNIAVRFDSGSINKNSTFVNNYVHSYTGTSQAVTMNANALFNYIETSSTSSNGQMWLNHRNVSQAFNNIIKTTGGVTGIFTLQREMVIVGNTIINNGAANAKGIVTSATADSVVYNNLLYNFNGASAIPFSILSPSTNNNFSILGNNAYFNSNAPSAHTLELVSFDLTANDITAAVDPFVDSANDDYTLIEAYRNTALSNPNSSLDIGAVQSAGSGGGGSSEFSFASIK